MSMSRDDIRCTRNDMTMPRRRHDHDIDPDITVAAVAKADDPGRKERERAEAINYLQVRMRDASVDTLIP